MCETVNLMCTHLGCPVHSSQGQISWRSRLHTQGWTKSNSIN